MESHNLEAYIKKVLSLSQQTTLSDTDLAQIAQDLGVDISMIERAHEVHLLKARNFLKFQNYDDAIQELQQAKVLKPSHFDTMFMLATAHAGRYEQHDKRTDKEQALELANQCLNLKPDYEPAAKLISFLKQDRQTTYQPTPAAPRRSPSAGLGIGIISGVILLVGLAMALLVFVPSKSTVFSSNNPIEAMALNNSRVSIHESAIALTPKGAVMWIVSYTQDTKAGKFTRDYTLHILDCSTQKIIKTMKLFSDVNISQNPMTALSCIDGKMYYFLDNGKDFEARDPRTGELLSNTKILSNQYPELSAGIGKIENATSNYMWWNITLRNGKKIRYSPYFKTLYTEQEATRIEQDYTQRQGWRDKFSWGILKEGDGEEEKHKLVLVKEKYRPFSLYTNDTHSLYNAYSPSQINSNSNYTHLCTTQETFLNPQMVYGNADFALITHATEINNNEQNDVLSLIDAKTGKIRWQITDLTQSPSVFMKQLGKKNQSVATEYRDQKLAMFVRWFVPQEGKGSNPAMCCLDLATGKVSAEFILTR